MGNFFEMQTSLVSTCKIRVTDITPWEEQNPRDTYALVLYWKDPVTGIWTVDNTNPDPGLWDIQAINNGNHDIYVFGVYAYISSFEDTSIVFYNGLAYIYIPGEGCPSPWIVSEQEALGNNPENSDCWRVATMEDYFNTGVYRYDWHGFYDVNCIFIVPVSTKLSCHNWRITNDVESSWIVTVNLYNLNDPTVVVATYQWDTATEDYIDIELPEDGIYEVELSYIVDEEVLYYPRVRIRDICGFLDCMVQLTKQILCNEKDPCCQSCSEEMKNQMQIWRDHLNMMMALYNSIEAALNIDLYYCMNNMLESDEAEENLQYLIELITKLNELADRCGECYGAQTTEATQPCKDC